MQFKTLWVLFVSTLLAACGGVESDFEQELGELEQELTVPSGYGIARVSLGPDLDVCLKTSGAECIYPKGKRVRMEFSGLLDGGCSGTLWQNAFNTAASEAFAWLTITHSTGFTNAGSGTADVVIKGRCVAGPVAPYSQMFVYPSNVGVDPCMQGGPGGSLVCRRYEAWSVANGNKLVNHCNAMGATQQQCQRYITNAYKRGIFYGLSLHRNSNNSPLMGNSDAPSADFTWFTQSKSPNSTEAGRLQQYAP
jgi:hypothetical protein